MTFDEAMHLAKRGRKVSHPGLNTGWYVIWEGKSPLYVHDALRSRIAAKVDDKEKTRTDWYEVNADRQR